MTQQKKQTQERKPSRQAADLIGSLVSTLREAEAGGGRSQAKQHVEAPYNVFTGNTFSGSNLIGGVAQGKARDWHSGGLVSMGALKRLGLMVNKGGRSAVLSIPSARTKIEYLPPEKQYKDPQTGELVTQHTKVIGMNFRPEPYFNIQEITDFDKMGIEPAQKEQRIATVNAESLLYNMAEAAGISCLESESGEPSYQVASDEILMPPVNVDDTSAWVSGMSRALFEGVAAPLRENRWSVLKEANGELRVHPEADNAVHDQYNSLVENEGVVAGVEFLEGMYRDQLLRRELFVTTVAALTGTDYVLDADSSLSADIIDQYYAPEPGAAFTGKILSNAGFAGTVTKMVIDFAEGGDPGHVLKWFPPKSQWPEGARAFNDTGIDCNESNLLKTADKWGVTPEEAVLIAPGLVPDEREKVEGVLPPMPETKEARKAELQDKIKASLERMRVPSLSRASGHSPAQQAELRTLNPFG